jgi:hypothetical protein
VVRALFATAGYGAAGCMVGVPRVVRELSLGSGAKDPQSQPVEGGLIWLYRIN